MAAVRALGGVAVAGEGTLAPDALTRTRLLAGAVVGRWRPGARLCDGAGASQGADPAAVVKAGRRPRADGAPFVHRHHGLAEMPSFWRRPAPREAAAFALGCISHQRAAPSLGWALQPCWSAVYLKSTGRRLNGWGHRQSALPCGVRRARTSFQWKDVSAERPIRKDRAGQRARPGPLCG